MCWHAVLVTWIINRNTENMMQTMENFQRCFSDGECVLTVWGAFVQVLLQSVTESLVRIPRNVAHNGRSFKVRRVSSMLSAFCCLDKLTSAYKYAAFLFLLFIVICLCDHMQDPLIVLVNQCIQLA